MKGLFKMKKLLYLSVAVSMYAFTAAAGEQQTAKANFEEYISDIKSILPEFAKFGNVKQREVFLLDKNNTCIATLRTAPEKYERKEGFDGFINTAVIIKDNKVIGVAVGKNSETPRWMKKVRSAGFLKSWNGKSVDEAKKLKVDAVTGATWSSNAIKSEVKAILSK